MISQIGPLVKAGTQNRKLLLAHVAGGALGGAGCGLLLTPMIALVGALSNREAIRGEVVAVSVLLLMGGLLDLRLPASCKTTSRQTPRAWLCAFGTTPGVFAWGIDLGVGVTTRLTAASFASLLLATVMLHPYWIATLVLTMFGIARAGSVAVVVILSRSMPRVSEMLAIYARSIRAAVGACAIAGAVALLMVSV